MFSPPVQSVFSRVLDGKFIETMVPWVRWCNAIAKGLGSPIESITVVETFNFPNLLAGASATLAVTVPGVKSADPQPVISFGFPEVEAGLCFIAWISDDDEITVRCTNASTGAINPAAFDGRLEVRRYA